MSLIAIGFASMKIGLKKKAMNGKEEGTNEKVIIIGGGLGGLSAAIRLQSRGFQVTILEKKLL